MIVSRRRFAGSAGAFAAAGIVRTRAGAAEFSFKLGCGHPTTHPIVIHATAVAQKVLEETNGRLEIRVYPNNMLGGDTQSISEARLGAIEMIFIEDGLTMNVVPVVGINAIPFAFSDRPSVYRAIDGILGKYTRAAVVKANVGLYPFETVWEAGFRQISNYLRPIFTPSDLKGMKIRIPASPINVDTFRALGATPVSTAGSEIYTALQQHLADGGDVTLASTETGKYYEVQKYISITNHLWQGYTLFANASVWQRLPATLREVAEKNFNAGALAERTDIARNDQALRTTIEGHGIAFNQAEIPAFRAALRSAGLYAKWRDQFGAEAWAVLEKATGKLT